jgi:hypothetical protein
LKLLDTSPSVRTLALDPGLDRPNIEDSEEGEESDNDEHDDWEHLASDDDEGALFLFSHIHIYSHYILIPPEPASTSRISGGTIATEPGATPTSQITAPASTTPVSSAPATTTSGNTSVATNVLKQMKVFFAVFVLVRIGFKFGKTRKNALGIAWQSAWREVGQSSYPMMTPPEVALVSSLDIFLL